MLVVAHHLTRYGIIEKTELILTLKTMYEDINWNTNTRGKGIWNLRMAGLSI